MSSRVAMSESNAKGSTGLFNEAGLFDMDACRRVVYYYYAYYYACVPGRSLHARSSWSRSDGCTT
jgi:hypothetical protein